MPDEPFNKYFLCNFEQNFKPADLPNEELRHLWSCEWNTNRLSNIVEHWLRHKDVELTLNEAPRRLSNAVELVLIFVQANFTGPFQQLEEFAEWLKSQLLNDYNPHEKLIENGEEINVNVQLGELLVIAREMLESLIKQWPESVFLQWWHLRLICIHQHMLDELTSNLYEKFQIAADFLLKHAAQLEDRELEGLLYLEVANGYLQYHRGLKAEEILNVLYQRLNITLKIEGLLGVRTKFQQKPLPQLCLKVEQSHIELPSSAVTHGQTELPKLLLLEDDTRLERIRFIEPKDNEVMSLPSVLQAVVLAQGKQRKRSTPKDRLSDEELEPYIQTLIYQEFGPLQVRQSVLFLNCVQEATQRRTVERSWKQCEECVKLLSETKYSLPERLSYAFAASLQPKWLIQTQLCELLVSLGMTKTALDIYLQIKAWPQVIDCYTRLDLRHKAAEIIRQELEKQPSVMLHCQLGDATDDARCYETAWEFSKHTSGRAQAHWGIYYFWRGEYEEAVSHLEKSVEINSLQEKIWLRLGYAAIKLERWELAVHAYITYTHLEPNGFESWNNLAKALIKLGDKKRAHKVLNESLKCNYSNWKVWENFMVVSVDTGNFEDAINAYNRLTDLKDRYLDLEVLCIIVQAIVEEKPDAKGQSLKLLHKKATTLLGHQCVRHAGEPKVWELASMLASTPLNKAQKLVRAVNAYTNKELEWSTKQPYALKALQVAQKVCELSLEAIDNHSSEESEMMITSQLNSARLAAQGVIRAVEKVTEKWAENEEALEELKTLLEQLTQRVKERMNVK